MTRKDYIKIAAVINQDWNVYRDKPEAQYYRSALLALAGNMADILADDTSRFDRDRFMEACTK